MQTVGPRSPTIRDATDANDANSHPPLPVLNPAHGLDMPPHDKTADGVLDGVVWLCIMAVPDADIKSGMRDETRPIGLPTGSGRLAYRPTFTGK